MNDINSPDPIHQLEESEACEFCHGDGCSLEGYKCYHCDGEGGHPEGWYFWNEVWADRYGPYESEEVANEKCREYARQL